MKKPKITPYYETTDGSAVKTLQEWKQKEIFHRLKSWRDGALDLSTDMFIRLVSLIVEDSADIVEILSIKEKGRPVGAKNRKPRVNKITTENPKTATLPLPIGDSESTQTL